MEKNSSNNRKILDKLYEYSKQHIPIFWLTKIGIKDLSFSQIEQGIISYLVPFLSGLIFSFISYLLRFYPDKTPFFLVYLLVAAVCSYFGGKASGIIVGIILMLGSLYNFGMKSFLEPSFFIVVSILISLIVDRARRTNEVRRLKKLESVYAKNYTDLFKRYKVSLNEIKSRDEFLTIASHELKTPLTSMLLKLNHMINTIRHVSFAEFSVPELLKVLDNAQVQIRWLSTMINDLLNVSLMTTGRMDLYKEEVDLVQLTNRIKENFSETLKKEKYQVKIEAEKPIVGYWDEARVEQVVTNLVSNAIKYGRSRPIDIMIANSGKTAKFIIRDHGIGISPIDRSIIFKPFKRPKSVEGYKKGLGVGLYLSRLIAEAHGGSIKVSSIPTQGTTFTLELPLKNGRV